VVSQSQHEHRSDSKEALAFLHLCFCCNPSKGVTSLACAGSGVPVDQVVQMVGALREHLLNAAPRGGSAAAAGGAANTRPAQGAKGRKRKNARAAAASGSGESEETAAQVG